MPRKAVYLQFESGDADEFEFFLAQKLGRTVVELGEMPNDEYVKWIVYYDRIAQRRDLATKRAKGRR